MDKDKLKRELAILYKMYETAKFDLAIFNSICYFLVKDYYDLFNEFDALRAELKELKKKDVKLAVPLDHLLNNKEMNYEATILYILNEYKDDAYRDYFSDRITPK